MRAFGQPTEGWVRQPALLYPRLYGIGSSLRASSLQLYRNWATVRRHENLQRAPTQGCRPGVRDPALVQLAGAGMPEAMCGPPPPSVLADRISGLRVSLSNRGAELRAGVTAAAAERIAPRRQRVELGSGASQLRNTGRREDENSSGAVRSMDVSRHSRQAGESHTRCCGDLTDCRTTV